MKKLKAKPTPEEIDDFAVGELVHDMAKPKAQKPLTADEVFGNDASKAVDAFETQLGLRQGVKLKAPNLIYTSRLLSPGYDDEDRDMLNQLLNDRELYQIIKMTDSWTARGDYKMFIIYAENQDVKNQRAGKKEIT